MKFSKFNVSWKTVTDLSKFTKSTGIEVLTHKINHKESLMKKSVPSFSIGFTVVVFNFEEPKNWKKKVPEYCLSWKIAYLDTSN